MRKIETGTRSRRRWTNRVATALIGAAAAGMALVVPAQAVPLFPGGPDIALPTLPTLPGLPAPAAPLAPLPPVEPQVGPANFSAPSLNPSEGEVVGDRQARSGDRAAAAAAYAAALRLYRGDLSVETDVHTLVERERLRALYLNQAVDARTSFLAPADWRVCKIDIDPDELAGQTAFTHR